MSSVSKQKVLRHLYKENIYYASTDSHTDKEQRGN